MTALYETAPYVPLMTSPGAHRVDAEEFNAGEVDAAFQSAAHIVTGTFETPTQHHNPMELFGTVAEWTDGRLTVYEGCQNLDAVKGALIRAFELSPDRIVVKSEQVGGGFGQKSPPKLQTALVAQAARLTRRPVKLVTPRGQLFHIANYRPRSVHNIRLAASAEGRLQAIIYDVVQETSRTEAFARPATMKISPACIRSKISERLPAIFTSTARCHATHGARIPFRRALHWKA